MGFFSKRLGRHKNGEKSDITNLSDMPQQAGQPVEEIYESSVLTEGELVCFPGKVLDTNSRDSIERFKHNLKILMAQAKEHGKIDKFKLIREDDFFPTGWEWRVLSKNTNLEQVNTGLSVEIKKAYALEQRGFKPYHKVNGMFIPDIGDRDEKIIQALQDVDRNLGAVLLPSRFRSTKHFTINTPLGVTGSYNQVEMNRDYIIIDDIDGFLSSEYAYSVAYRDAYLDISHESLPISTDAVVLINEANYERIMSDEQTATELTGRRVVRFKGDEIVAIDMILTEMGVLPSMVGRDYAEYDQEIYDILDNSMRDFAKKNSLLFDQSHAAITNPAKGHFSSYYDKQNRDYEEAFDDFMTFLRQRFPKHEELFNKNLTTSCADIVYEIGTTELLAAIDEYNEREKSRLQSRLKVYLEDRKNITPEVHRKFVDTVALINHSYQNTTNYESYRGAEETIRKFFQAGTVEEQLEAAKVVSTLLPSPQISIVEATVKALYCIRTEQVNLVDSNEQLQEQQMTNEECGKTNDK